MRYEVLLTEKAEHDLESIRDYILETDSPASADRTLDVLLGMVGTLEQFPERAVIRAKRLRSDIASIDRSCTNRGGCSIALSSAVFTSH